MRTDCDFGGHYSEQVSAINERTGGYSLKGTLKLFPRYRVLLLFRVSTIYSVRDKITGLVITYNLTLDISVLNSSVVEYGRSCDLLCCRPTSGGASPLGHLTFRESKWNRATLSMFICVKLHI